MRRRPWLLWFRLYVHALLLESRIFPNVELCDESPEYVSHGFTDTWKGNHRGELVCIKAIRLRYPPDEWEIDRVCTSFVFSEVYSVRFLLDISSCSGRDQAQPSSKCALSHRGFRDIISVLHHESVDAHGNITQYVEVNPGANRLMLVCAHQLEYRRGRPTACVHNSLPRCARV